MSFKRGQDVTIYFGNLLHGIETVSAVRNGTVYVDKTKYRADTGRAIDGGATCIRLATAEDYAEHERQQLAQECIGMKNSLYGMGNDKIRALSTKWLLEIRARLKTVVSIINKNGG